MSIASWLMAGLGAFVLLGPALMVAVLVSGVSRQGALASATVGDVDVAEAVAEPADEVAWPRVA